ncbi:MAG: FG-GAP repeat protein [Thermoplasmata archaeon]|nr:FG-GAP repeat protein [Thermoplasmata archaeon]
MSRRRGSAYLLALTIALTFTLPLHITSNSSSLAEKDVGENLPRVMASPGLSLKTLTAEEISLYTGMEDPSLSSSCSMAVGDVNGDGEDDLVVALPPQTYNYNGEGAVHIIYSFVNSASSLPVNKTSHVVIVGNLSFRGIGRQIVVTDMDGDGLDDIIITAPDSNGRGGGRTQYGELFIVKGRREGLWGIVNVDDVADYHLIGTSTALHFGRAIAVGDFNGDGKKDLAVSSDYINSTFGEMRRGAVFLIQGDDVWKGDRRVGRENINGSVDDELLGVSLAAGDFDGDGVDDLAISSKKVLVGNGRMDGGGVHLFKGGEYLFTSQMYSNKSNVTVYSDNKGDGLGVGLRMTDLDGDGKMELLMGAPGADLNGDDSGCVFVLKGGSTPSTTLNISAAQTDENITGNDAGDMFGYTITVIDADGDGVNEILISAPGGAGEGNKRPFSGEIYSFTSSSLLFGENISASDSSYVIQSRSYHLGIFLSSGYVEGKGVLLAVAPGGRPTEDMVNKSGHIMVLSLMGGEEKVIFGEVGSHFGSSVVFGDFNGDGRLDLAVGARYWSNTLSSNPAQHVSQCGGVFIFYNASELPPITDLRLESADVILSGTESSMLFGVSLDVGDLNGDGVDDLVIGAPHASSPPFSWQAGRVFILFGNHSLPSFATLPSGVWDTMIYGQRAGDKFGYSLGVGDLDGDGIDDLAVGAPEADGPSDSRDQAGDVYLFFGRNTWPRQGWCNSLKNVTVWGAVSRERLSFGDIIIEDLNNDGYGEIVIGSSTASPLSIVQEGEVTIVWGMNRTDWGSFSSGYDLSTDPSVIIAGAFRGDLLGTAISVVELRGTVSVERALAIGAPGSDGLLRNTPNSGAVFMVALKDVLGKNGTYRVHRIASCVVEETIKNAYMGSSLLSAYLDSDSTLDLIIGAPGKDVVYLATTPYLPLNSTLQTDILPSLTPPGERFSLFGTSIAAEDVDGDGETDVVVGSPLSAVEGGVGGSVLIFPKAVANIPETRIHVSPITGGVVEKDSWGRIVLFPTESPYTLNITVYLPPALSSIIDGVDVIAHSKDGASWVNLSRYGNSHPGGGGGIKFLNTSAMTTGLASLDLCLNFTVPLTTDEPVRWFSIFLKNNTVGEVGLWRFPVRWYSVGR